MRDTKDRSPELRLLRIGVALRLLDRARLEGSSSLFHLVEEFFIVLTGSELFSLFWIRTFGHCSLSTGLTGKYNLKLRLLEMRLRRRIHSSRLLAIRIMCRCQQRFGLLHRLPLSLDPSAWAQDLRS